MTPGETIKIKGKQWRVKTATDDRLVLHAVTEHGKELQDWIKEWGFTQRQAAETLQVKQPLIARIISGSRSMPDHVLDRIRKLRKP